MFYTSLSIDGGWNPQTQPPSLLRLSVTEAPLPKPRPQIESKPREKANNTNDSCRRGRDRKLIGEAVAFFSSILSQLGFPSET